MEQAHGPVGFADSLVCGEGAFAGMVAIVTSTSLRILGAVLLTLTLMAGVYLSGKTRRDAERRVDDLRDAATLVEESASSEPPLVRSLAFDPGEFQARLAEDIESFGLEPVTIESLSQPNRYSNELSESVTLSPGKSWTSEHLAIRTRLDKVSFMQRGAEIRSVHVVAQVRNVSTVPIAYRLRMRGDKGKCQVHGSREHNAISLRPGDEIDIVVCAGRDNIVIESVEVLEVTALGHHYLSQLSPLALGGDSITATAHRPRVSVPACVNLNAKTLAGFIEIGTARWVDIVDYYSRHNCHRLQFFPGYTAATEPLPRLPAIAPRER